MLVRKVKHLSKRDCILEIYYFTHWKGIKTDWRRNLNICIVLFECLRSMVVSFVHSVNTWNKVKLLYVHDKNEQRYKKEFKSISGYALVKLFHYKRILLYFECSWEEHFAKAWLSCNYEKYCIYEVGEKAKWSLGYVYICFLFFSGLPMNLFANGAK